MGKNRCSHSLSLSLRLIRTLIPYYLLTSRENIALDDHRLAARAKASDSFNHPIVLVFLTENDQLNVADISSADIEKARKNSIQKEKPGILRYCIKKGDSNQQVNNLILLYLPPPPGVREKRKFSMCNNP